MSNQLSDLYSDAARRVKPSAIRQLVPFTKRPGVISFAGGWPAAELFPTDVIGEIAQAIMAEEGAAALQYGATMGDPRLLAEINARLAARHGLEAPAGGTLITTGGQQAIYLLAWMLLDPGDSVVVESPSYVGGLGIFNALGANVIDIPMDADGLRTDVLAEKLAAGVRLKCVYTVPDFQNPTGLTMARARREALVALAEQYDFIILEDAPYADLRYEGEAVPPIFALDPHGRTAYLGSFSKIFAPLRLGWLIARPELAEKAAVAKQQIDLCTPALTQAIAYHYCRRGLLAEQIARTRSLYRHKRDVMLGALDGLMPAGVDWTAPHGGMFLWMTLPEHVSADALFYAAVEEKVAFVVGSAFYPRRPDVPTNVLRLNFVTPAPEQIQTGVARLADVVKRALA